MQPEPVVLVPPSVSPEREMTDELERIVGSLTFNHWFRDNACIEIDAQQAVVGVKNAFLLTWMQHRFRSAVTDAARRVIGAAADVRFEARPADGAVALPAAPGSLVVCRQPPESAADNSSQHPRPRQTAPASESQLSEDRRPETGTLEKHSAEPQPAIRSFARRVAAGSTRLSDKRLPEKVPAEKRTSKSGPTERPAPAAQAGRRFADLADFVKGPCNELALTAALQVCEQPGARYNPVVLYGGVGTGKTHLLEAIYRRTRVRFPSFHVLFLSAEAFANYFTQALRDRTLPSFRQRFRTVDILMVDDVDFLDGKRVIQEEFLHTIKQLESHERQIVLSADRHPRLLTKLSEELVTRFIAGLVCRIEAPDLETRRTIVARKAAKLATRISDEALEFVVQRFGTSVRELEGALNGLETYAAMTGKNISLSTARQVLADLLRDCVRIVRLADVEQTVCRFFGVQPDELRSARRTRSVSQPRMMAMYLARKMTQAAYSEIGEYFGGRNHSTVMSAEKRCRDLLASQATVRVAAQSWNFGDVMSSLEQQLLAG